MRCSIWMARTFCTIPWQRPEGGGGISCVMEQGNVLERGGVNFSYVMGDSGCRHLPALPDLSWPDAGSRQPVYR